MSATSAMCHNQTYGRDLYQVPLGLTRLCLAEVGLV